MTGWRGLLAVGAGLTLLLAPDNLRTIGFDAHRGAACVAGRERQVSISAQGIIEDTLKLAGIAVYAA